MPPAIPRVCQKLGLADEIMSGTSDCGGTLPFPAMNFRSTGFYAVEKHKACSHIAISTMLATMVEEARGPGRCVLSVLLPKESVRAR